MENLAQTISATDINAAVKWLDSIPADTSVQVRNSVLQTIMFSWATADPAAAVAYLENANIDPSFYSSGYLPQFETILAKSDSNAALAWATTLPDGDVRNTGIRCMPSCPWLGMMPQPLSPRPKHSSLGRVQMAPLKQSLRDGVRAILPPPAQLRRF